MNQKGKKSLHRVLLIITFFGAAIFLPSHSRAVPFERLVMPGEVIEGHAKYEEECSNCHRPFSKITQEALCLDCHKKVAADVKRKEGFHGKSADARETECRHCHAEHKGRGAKVVLLDKELFDHELTDFPIKGGHLKIECGECHESRKKYRDAKGKCIDCHKKGDPHKGNLGKDCSKCHSERSWKRIKFDHGKTDFDLKGKHKDVKCASCHPGDRYKKTPKDCFSCHALNDSHRGQYGKECKDCHTPREWKRTVFDHDKTKFRLEWKHRDVPCGRCHKGKNIYKEKLPKDCYGCHKNDDTHRGRYGKKCEDCHSEKGWKKNTFDHDKSDFPLRAKHKKAKCVACHRGPIKENTDPRKCYDCHKADDAHKGQEGKECEKCHNERGWRTRVFFDHDLTKFPLIGLHAVTSCEQCHIGTAYKDTPMECVKCHKADDEHKRGLGTECGLCHNPNDWRLWRFDHEDQTEFDLDGKHKDLGCEACHFRPVRKKVRLSRACSSCHREDDEHRGGFGMICERCHTTKSFREISIDH